MDEDLLPMKNNVHHMTKTTGAIFLPWHDEDFQERYRTAQRITPLDADRSDNNSAPLRYQCSATRHQLESSLTRTYSQREAYAVVWHCAACTSIGSYNRFLEEQGLTMEAILQLYFLLPEKDRPSFPEGHPIAAHRAASIQEERLCKARAQPLESTPVEDSEYVLWQKTVNSLGSPRTAAKPLVTLSDLQAALRGGDGAFIESYKQIGWKSVQLCKKVLRRHGLPVSQE